jgi:hypothetical protein
MGRTTRVWHHRCPTMMERPMPFDDLSKSLVVLDQDSTLICVIELSLSSWLGGQTRGRERDGSGVTRKRLGSLPDGVR